MYAFNSRGRAFERGALLGQGACLTVSSRVSHVLLHEAAKAREVCGHTGDAHHGAFGCQGNKDLASDPRYSLLCMQ